MAGQIEDYAIVGDLHSTALIGRDGSVDWLCLPRFDSAAFFAGLLGDDRNGHWQIAPVGAGNATRRRYRENTLILEHDWDTPDGSVRVIDFMPPDTGQHDLVRIVEGISGVVPIRSTLRLRFDYGRSVPWMRKVDGQLIGIAGPDGVAFSTPVPTIGRDLTTYADFTIRPGERVPFVLTWYPSHREPPQPADAIGTLHGTERFWTEWAGRCTYSGPYREAVLRSLITLKALTFKPTGGIVAAPTTSLPEKIGGVRNWDYRYCWLRDASFTIDALIRGGYVDEARKWRDWLLRAVAGNADDVQIMYGLAGERRLNEEDLPWLPGYEGSRPVRLGNAASEQFQLDVYGEVLDALSRARAYGVHPEPHAWDLQRLLLDAVERRWQEPDEGLWEIRGPKRQFVHSKVLAWVAVDRMICDQQRFGLRGDTARWRRLRDEIHAEVLDKGFDAERNTFVQSYGSADLDAALLQIPLMGFLPPDDPRVVGTVEAVHRELSVDGGFVLRYRTQDDGANAIDGLPGDEGAFLACSFWLVEALCLIDRRDEAEKVFEGLLRLRNDVGLLAEEYDPRIGRQVGNFPQALSHIPLCTAAYQLADLPGPPTRTGA